MCHEIIQEFLQKCSSYEEYGINLNFPKYHQLALTKIDEATKEVNEGIAKFEQTLKSTYGISTKVKKADAERAVSESINNGSSPLRNTNKSQRFASVSSKGMAAIKNPFAQSIRAAAT